MAGDPNVVRDLVAQYDSWEAACDEAERRPEWEHVHVWGDGMSYTERVITVLTSGVEPAPTVGVGHRHRDELPLAGINEAADELAARKAVVGTGRRAPANHSYKAIASRVSKKAKFVFTKDRIKQIDDLIEAGWDVRKSHPSFSAQRGFVVLPTPREAVLLLRFP
jgi:hypothetical protein